jgi:hypothetical protein
MIPLTLGWPPLHRAPPQEINSDSSITLGWPPLHRAPPQEIKSVTLMTTVNVIILILASPTATVQTSCALENP